MFLQPLCTAWLIMASHGVQAVLVAAWAVHFLLHAAWGKLVTALGPGLLSASTGIVVTATAAALAYASYKVLHVCDMLGSVHSR